MSEILVPTILTNINGKDTAADPVSVDLEKHRMIHITGEITSTLAACVISQMRYLDGKSGDPIILCINSPGGSVYAGLAIFDYMKQGVHCDVITMAVGMAASMGAFLLAAGTKGKRFASRSTEIMIHQPLGGVQGQATDITLVADHIQYLKKKLAGHLAEACGKTPEELLRDTERDHWLNSEAALAYGLIDHIGIPET